MTTPPSGTRPYRDLTCAYDPLTVGAVLEPETHWPHVFAVMKALGGRFGDESVRLVVAFE